MSFAKQAALTLATRILVTVISLLTGVLTARALGPEGKGVLSLVTLIPATLLLFTGFNIGSANVYYLNRQQISLRRTIAANYLAATLLGGLSVLLAFLLFQVWPDASVQVIRKRDSGLIALASASIFIVFFNGNFNAILLAYQRMRLYNLTSLVAETIRVSAIYLFLYPLQLGVAGALWATIVVGVLEVAFVHWNVYRLQRAIQHAAEPSTDSFGIRQVLRKLFSFGARSSLNNIVWTLILRADMFLVSAFLGVAAVGYYGLAVGISETLRLLPTTIGTVMFPRAAKMDREARVHFIAKVSRFTFWSVLIFSTPLIVAGELVIRTLYSEAFLPASNALSILVLATVLLSIANVAGYEFVTSERPEINAYINAFGLALNIALNCWLIPWHGIAGAAMASMIAYGGISLLTLMVMCRMRNVRMQEFFVPEKADWEYLGEATRRWRRWNVVPAHNR